MTPPIPPEHVEAVARALCAEMGDDPDARAITANGDDLGAEWEMSKDEAETALTAALALGYRYVGEGEVVAPREPTPDMYQTAHYALDGIIGPGPRNFLRDKLSKSVWDAMITAHQKEGGE